MSINIVDIETYGEDVVTPYCMGISSFDKIFFTYGKHCIRRGLIEIFKRSPNKSIYYAHNLTFDGLLIIDNMGVDFELDPLTTFMVRGNIYSLGIRYKSTLIIFRCSFRLLPLGLGEVAELLGVPEKGNIKHESINEENYLKYRDEVVAYCKRDLEITKSLILRLNEELKEILPE